jgi:hypothetical protein
MDYDKSDIAAMKPARWRRRDSDAGEICWRRMSTGEQSGWSWTSAVGPGAFRKYWRRSSARGSLGSYRRQDRRVPQLSAGGQELRARRIGRVVVNSVLDRPWSQYFCCMLAGSTDYVEHHPVATKRVVRAILKAADLCASEPARAARMLVDGGFTPALRLCGAGARGAPVRQVARIRP